MSEILIKVPGVPVAKNRPSPGFKDKNTVFGAQQQEMNRFTAIAQEQIKRNPFVGPIEVDICFVMPMIAGVNPGQYHWNRPRIDELVEFALDCLEGEAWFDNRQVVKSSEKKVYGHEPCTWIIVRDNISC